MTFHKISKENFVYAMRSSDLEKTISYVESNLEGGNYFWQEDKTDCYKHNPHSYDYKVYYRIGQLFSFQDTFFGTKLKPAFIQDNVKKQSITVATAYRYVPGDDKSTKTKLEIGIGKNIPQEEHEKFLTSVSTLHENLSFWPWAEAEISIEKNKENEHFHAEMWVNGNARTSLTTHALRGFMYNLYQPILYSLGQEEGIVHTRYPDNETKKIIHTAERRMTKAFL